MLTFVVVAAAVLLVVVVVVVVVVIITFILRSYIECGSETSDVSRDYSVCMEAT
jgi:hypothetical protein